ncbi:ATP-binding protein, partial [Massilia terrae]
MSLRPHSSFLVGALLDSWRQNVVFRLGAGIVLAVALTTGVYTSYVTHTLRAEAHEQLQERVERQAQVLSQALAQPLFDINSAAVSSVVDSVGATPEVMTLRVLSPTGAVLASLSGTAEGPGIRVARTITYNDGNRTYPVGSVELAFSAQPVLLDLRRQIVQTITANVLLTLAIALSVLLVGRRMTQPFVDIQVALEKLARGDTDIELSGIGRRDQVGQLSSAVQSFRDTLNRLRRAEQVTNGLLREKSLIEQQLRELNEDLEQRIAARTAELTAANVRAEAANVAKGEFLANMSHEIRTPMSAILGMAYLALRTDLNPKQHDYVSKIHRAALSLLGIINDILDFSKIEAGKLDVEEIPFSLDEVLANVTSVTSQKAAEKQLAYLVQVPDQVPRGLVGDPLRLGQVLINLVNNAVKFTPGGQIELSCALLAGAAAGHARLRFAVRDSGIGMSAQQQAKLFRAFSQANGSTTREYGGTGLGLSISQQLVGLMGGAIAVDSSPGKGSIFSFELAFAIAPLPAPVARRAESAQPLAACKTARVLLVEDNLVNQQIAAELMRAQGIEVAIAATGQQALDMLERAGPDGFDLVLMDLEMPQLDGHAATAALRRDPRFDRVPVIAMTAHALAEIRERCLAEGMQDYITKPAEPEKLYATLARWLGRALAPVQGKLSSAPAPLPMLGGLDSAAGLRTVGGNRTLYLQLLQRLRETQRDAGGAIRSAYEAGDRE